MDSDALINRIDLFVPVRSLYGVLHHFTEKLAEALIRSGVSCRLLEAERENPGPFLEKLFSDPPDCTLSFNGLLPDEEGRFFCEMIKIPHVCCLVDSPNHYFSLAKSPYSIIACSDTASCDFFHGLNTQNVLFMPHGVDKNISAPLDNGRIYDVLLLSSYIDYEKIRESWQHRHSEALCQALEDAATLTLSDPEKGYVQAFVETLNGFAKDGTINPKDVDFVDILDDLEMYIRGLDRVRLVKSITDAEVHIFGSSIDGEGSWQKALKGQKNVIIHDSIPYEDAIELMKHSKVVLNSYPTVKHGAHERLFAGTACGALTITSENSFLKETFTEGKDILFYRHNETEKVNELINTYLKDKKKREEMVSLGREVVMRNHTWDHRAKKLIEELTPMLERIKSSSSQA